MMIRSDQGRILLTPNLSRFHASLRPAPFNGQDAHKSPPKLTPPSHHTKPEPEQNPEAKQNPPGQTNPQGRAKTTPRPPRAQNHIQNQRRFVRK